ncbi:MAG TPA: hypothetical protein VMG12_05850 [Polyangiaceae bacterium]|nr:hypothetical protein [Polyangiaceae bacterium]
MRVRCTATADYRGNAVGELELECQADGLCIALRGVSSYREGYAPGPPVHAGDVCVPWPAVYATRLGLEQLQLSVDARNLPLNRFLLGEFVERPPDADGVVGQRRLPHAIGAAGLVVLGVALALARALPHARAIGTLGWAGLAVVVALGVIAWRARGEPRPPSHVVLDELCHELARYVPHHISAAEPTPAPRSFEPVALSRLLPRSAVAIAITLAAATLAALVGSSAARPSALRLETGTHGTGSASPTLVQNPLTAGVFTGSEPGPLPASTDPPAAATAPAATVPAGTSAGNAIAADAPVVGATCECRRHESLLWQAPPPRLSPVIVSERRRLHDGHEHTELELALINDGASEARRLEVSVVFFEPGNGDRAGQWQTGERALYFEGPLAPGQATRWHVEGRGTSFDVIAPDRGSLAADGSDAAPAEAFARLASSGARALRLHATSLLAFLGDERVGSAAAALRGSASPAEGAYLDRVLEAPSEVIACGLSSTRTASLWQIEACVYNRSDQPATGLDVRSVAFDAPLDRLRPGARAPLSLAEQQASLSTALPAHGGRRVRLELPLALPAVEAPRAFELRVARAEAQP